jgi:hypothetical protein
VALLAEHIPKHHRTGFAFEIINLQFLRALQDFRTISTCLTEAGKVALHVGHKNRHTAGAKILCECLQRNCLPCARGASDQTVAVCHFREQKDLFLRLSNENGIEHDLNGNPSLLGQQTSNA